MSSKEDNNLSDESIAKRTKVKLTINGNTNCIQWNKQMSLLDAILNAGVSVPYSCCSGKCATCVCKLKKGEVTLKRNFVLSEAHIQQGLILTCVAVPKSESIEINYDVF